MFNYILCICVLQSTYDTDTHFWKRYSKRRQDIELRYNKFLRGVKGETNLQSIKTKEIKDEENRLKEKKFPNRWMKQVERSDTSKKFQVQYAFKTTL